MVSDCQGKFAGPSCTYLTPKEQQLTQDTWCEDRDCDVVLRETYHVTQWEAIDDDEDGLSIVEVLEAMGRQLQNCPDGSRRITEVENAELSRNDLHAEAFAVVYELPETGVGVEVSFEQRKTSKTRCTPKQL